MLDAFNYLMKEATMGCDIHWYSETRKDGQWACDQAGSFHVDQDGGGYIEMDNFPGGDRDYWFFGLLNHVRTEWPWSFPEQSTPLSGLSYHVQALMEQWDSDGHSHGILTRAQFKEKLEELKRACAEELIHPTQNSEAVQHLRSRVEDTVEAMLRRSPDVPDGDHRIVFWFDN